MTSWWRLPQRAFRADTRGAALIEFALVLPWLLLFIVGGLEIGFNMYVNAVFTGQIQKAGRDIGLESSSNADAIAAVEQKVTDAVHQLLNDSDITKLDYSVKSFHDYKNAASRPEEFNDVNGNGKCDNKETFVDGNGNGKWDLDGASDSRGGAKDVVLLTATLTYYRPKIIPTFDTDPTVTLQASTLLRNQPSSDQAQPPTGTCP